MRTSGVVVGLFTWGFFLLSTPGFSCADNAEVLPKGVSRVSVEGKFFLPFDKRFNPDGDVEDVAVDFNGSLNSGVFPGLGQVEAAFGLPRGSASLGTSVVAFEYTPVIAEFAVQYGVTDRLTAGVLIPYWWMTNRVNARLDTSTATVGKSPRLGLGPLVPLGATPDATPLTTEDAQQLLGNGLDVNNDGSVDVRGFGFKRVETWSDNGVGDIEAGLRYQYLKTEDWRLAFTGGLRFPTGRFDDPDNLVDYPFGGGAYGLFFRFNHDYTGVNNLVLNGTFRYTLVLPDRKVKRVPDDVDQPITLNKVKVERDLGDEFEFETSGTYTLFTALSASVLYQFGFKLKDRVSGTQQLAFTSLEDETNWTSHIFIVGLSYTTVPLFREKKFPIPLTASIAYRNRVAGSNNVLKSQFISFALAVFF